MSASMARKRKHGPRAKSGRLSRAYKSPDLRDHGTPENQARRAYTINGADPQLVATASGILLANGFISQDQHHAALTYARLHSLVFGKAWCWASPLSWELGAHGHEPGEELIARARRRLDALNDRLDPDQRQAVGNVCIIRPHPDVVLRCPRHRPRHQARRARASGAGDRARRAGAMKGAAPKDGPLRLRS
jgi:hypothetical protein